MRSSKARPRIRSSSVPSRRRRRAISVHARFGAAGVTPLCITLAARRDAILDPGRGRAFDPGEEARIAEMIDQGYGARRFSDLIVATDRNGFMETVAELAAGCRLLLAAS